jgi:hypothetical protein
MFANSKYTPSYTLSSAKAYLCTGEKGYRYGFSSMERDDELSGQKMPMILGQEFMIVGWGGG